MSLTTTQSAISYNGNGVATAFPVPFPFLDDTHLLVVRYASNGDVWTLLRGTHFTVAGARNPTGGTVTLTTPLASGDTVVITREVPLTQGTSFRTQGSFSPALHEEALDKLAMVDQQQQRQLGEVDSAVSTLGGRLDSLEPRTDTLETRATTLEVRATNLETRALSVEGTAMSLESRLDDTVEPALATLGTRATALEGRATWLESSFDSAELRADVVDDRVATLEGRTTTLEGTTSSLDTRVGTLEAAPPGGGSSQWVDGAASAIYYGAGNVGIGSSVAAQTPQRPLHVAWSSIGGPVIIQNTASNGFSNITYADTVGASKGTIGFVNTSVADLRAGKVLVQGYNTDVVIANDSAGTITANAVFKATGEVGLGTTSPTVKLDVVGDAKVSGSLNVDGNTLYVDAVNNKVNVGTTSIADTFGVAGSARFNGIVGISTAKPAAADANYHVLWLKGDTSVGGESQTNFESIALRSNIHRTAGSGWALTSTSRPGWATTMGHGSSLDYWEISRTPAGGNPNTPPAPLLRVAGDGNVGFGTATPGEKLDVMGNVRLSAAAATSGTTTVDSPAVVFRPTAWSGSASVTPHEFRWYADSVNATTSQLRLSVNGADKLTIDGVGGIYPVAAFSNNMGSNSLPFDHVYAGGFHANYSFDLLSNVRVDLSGKPNVQSARLAAGDALTAHVFGNLAALTNGAAKIASFCTDTGATEKLAVGQDGKLTFNATDATGTPGDTTINKPSGRAAIAAGATACTVTCSSCTAASVVQVTPMDLDATLLRIKVVPSAGGFVVTGNAAATAVFRFMFTVFN